MSRPPRFPYAAALCHDCLVTNHVHPFFEAGRDDTLAKSMHSVGTSFVRELDKAAGRKGHLWEGRYRSTAVEAPACFVGAGVVAGGPPLGDPGRRRGHASS